MPDYRRYRVPGGTYFFTVNLLERYPNDLLVQYIDRLRTVVREVRIKRPFHIDAWAVLPDHLHGVWTLSPGDDDFTNRWRLIKQGFSKALPPMERRSKVRIARRAWDMATLALGARHPRRRGLCGARGLLSHQPGETRLRSMRGGVAVFNVVRRTDETLNTATPRCVERGIYPLDWAGGPEADLEVGERA